MLDSQKQIVSIFLFALLIFVVWQLIQIFSPFLEAAFWALILTFAFYPFHQWVSRKIKKPNRSALITTCVIILVVVMPAFSVVVNLLSQTLEIYQYLAQGGMTQIIERFQALHLVQMLKENLSRSELISNYVGNIPGRLTRFLGDVSTTLLARATKNTVFIVFNFLIMIFMIFFFTRDGQKIYNFVYGMSPFEKKHRDAIFSKINETFTSVIRGQFMTSIAQGILAGSAFFVLGLPAPVLIGFLTFISSLIPVIGASGVWVPFTIYLFAQQAWLKGIALLLIGVFIISLVDNILKPLLIGERMKIPPFLLFLGILGGLNIYGMMGMFLGPLLITLFFTLVHIYKERYRI